MSMPLKLKGKRGSKPMIRVSTASEQSTCDISTLLTDVCVLVDVRVGSEDVPIDCSDVIARKLKEMGATIVKRYTSKLTHVVLSHVTKPWKDKIAKWMSHHGNSLHIVSQLWVNACVVNKQKVKESAFYPACTKEKEEVTTPTTVKNRKQTTPSSHSAKKRRALSMEPMASDAILKLLESNKKKQEEEEKDKENSLGVRNQLLNRPRRQTIDTVPSRDTCFVSESGSSDEDENEKHERHTSKDIDAHVGSITMTHSVIAKSIGALPGEWTCCICSTLNVKTRRLCKECKSPRVATKVKKNSASALSPSRLSLQTSINSAPSEGEKTKVDSKSKPTPVKKARIPLVTPNNRNKCVMTPNTGKNATTSIRPNPLPLSRKPTSLQESAKDKGQLKTTLDLLDKSISLRNQLLNNAHRETTELKTRPRVDTSYVAESDEDDNDASNKADQQVSAIEQPPNTDNYVPSSNSCETPSASLTISTSGAERMQTKSNYVITTPVAATKGEWTCSICSCLNAKSRRICKDCKTSRVTKNSTNQLTPGKRIKPGDTTVSVLSSTRQSSTLPPANDVRKRQNGVAASPITTRVKTPVNRVKNGTRTPQDETLPSDLPKSPPLKKARTCAKQARPPRAVIGITGVDIETRGVIECAIHAIDANLSSETNYRKARVVKSADYATSVTHLIVGRDTKRTLKVLFAIARGAWIVSESWVFASLEHERWLPEQEYEMELYANRTARQYPERRLIFRSIKFFVGANVEPSRELLISLIQCVGGEIVNQISVAHYCVCEDGSLFRRSQRTGGKVVNSKWIFDSIANMKVQDQVDSASS